MTQLTAKTTIYLSPKLKKAARLYSVHSGISVSELIEQSLIAKLEDIADSESYEKYKNDETVSFEEAFKMLEVEVNISSY